MVRYFSVALAISRHPIFIPLRAESGLSGGTSASLSVILIPGWVCCLEVDRGEKESLKKRPTNPLTLLKTGGGIVLS